MGESHYDKAIELCKSGENFINELKKRHIEELHRYKEAGIKKVEILTAGPGNSCEECYKLHGKVLTIEEALKTMPLPVRGCNMDVFGVEKGFCRCGYVADL
ncbi:MAG: hypothetical protein NTW64_01805 [Candidatus Omnitrophica bacterium]|nr:hypothetical protein [Candidatus Omnitrophota bacterium]